MDGGVDGGGGGADPRPREAVGGDGVGAGFESGLAGDGADVERAAVAATAALLGTRAMSSKFTSLSRTCGGDDCRPGGCRLACGELAAVFFGRPRGMLLLNADSQLAAGLSCFFSIFLVRNLNLGGKETWRR